MATNRENKFGNWRWNPVRKHMQFFSLTLDAWRLSLAFSKKQVGDVSYAATWAEPESCVSYPDFCAE